MRSFNLKPDFDLASAKLLKHKELVMLDNHLKGKSMGSWSYGSS